MACYKFLYCIVLSLYPISRQLLLTVIQVATELTLAAKKPGAQPIVIAGKSFVHSHLLSFTFFLLRLLLFRLQHHLLNRVIVINVVISKYNNIITNYDAWSQWLIQYGTISPLKLSPYGWRDMFIIISHFSGPGTATGPVRECICVSEQQQQQPFMSIIQVNLYYPAL